MINREKIQKLHELTSENTKQLEIASEQLRIAQDRYGEEEVSLERDGKKQNLREKILWDEVFYFQGADCQARRILKQRHPEVFETYEKQNNAAAELHKFCLVELGFDFTKMTVSDYVALTEQMFKMLMDEHAKKDPKEVEA
jgi:hypothetical protein